MEKFHITFETPALAPNETYKHTYRMGAESAELMEQKIKERFPSATNVNIRKLSYVLDAQIREHLGKIQIDIGEVKADDKWANERMGEIKSRLQCCADAALMFGTDSQESLERSLGRMVESGHKIVGLDGHMFSFQVRYSFGAYGALIFHCSAKDWSTHS